MLAEAPADGPVEAGGKGAEEGREDAEALGGAIGVGQVYHIPTGR